MLKHRHTEVVRKIVEALDEEIRSRGRGSIRALDRAFGSGSGWWQHRVDAGRLTLSQLLAVLDHLGLDAVAFVRRALGSEESLELDRPRGAPPEIVVKARERVRSGVEGSGVGEAYLTTLDQQRYEKPAEVVKMALWAVEHVELAHLPRLLGVAGSAWRLLIELEEAGHAIHAGLEIAEKRGDRVAVGDLLQRLSYVAADSGEHAEALRIAERAAIVYLRAGDQVGMAKALVDQGIWLYYLDRVQESIVVLKTALETLPDNETRFRCAAFQVLGLNYRQAGELDAALRHLAEAEDIAQNLESLTKGKIGWLKGEIYFDLRRFNEAETSLLRVIDVFRRCHLGEMALVTCDLLRLYLTDGRSASACHLASSMHSLLEPLRHNRIISAAIGNLLRSREAGLTLTQVEQAKAQIASERQRQKNWLSLTIKRS